MTRISVHPTTFTQAKDLMKVKDWLKRVEKKLVVAPMHGSRESYFIAHQLYGTAGNWWKTYCNTHANVNIITGDKFKAYFCTHYVPRGTIKLKEFTDLRQDSMTVNEYINSFIQLSRYAPNDTNTDEKK
jgi:hypothetical protein